MEKKYYYGNIRCEALKEPTDPTSSDRVLKINPFSLPLHILAMKILLLACAYYIHQINWDIYAKNDQPFLKKKKKIAILNN